MPSSRTTPLVPFLTLLALLSMATGVDLNYAIWNASDLHLWWRVDCVPDGATFIDTNGVIPPHAGQTICSWTAPNPGETAPDAMAGVISVFFSDDYDLERFQACVSGPAIRKRPECWWFDFDLDGDVDQVDFGIVQARKDVHR